LFQSFVKIVYHTGFSLKVVNVSWSETWIDDKSGRLFFSYIVVIFIAFGALDLIFIFLSRLFILALHTLPTHATLLAHVGQLVRQ
jgi:hypothetical protein